jgi:hypothetical protein
MKIDNTELLKFLEAVNNNLLRLIMQLIALSEAVAAGLSVEAQHNPEIHRQLGNDIRGQLMQLHSILEQILRDSRMRWHSQPHREKLLKDNGLIVVWLRDSLFPRLGRETFQQNTLEIPTAEYGL